jgi:predicted CXXCH cytochrome family protein
MKKSSTGLFTIIGLLIVWSAAQASIEGSDHDLSGQGAKVCDACHVPHNAAGASLWSGGSSGLFSGMADLCYNCHDGSITDVGLTTAFDLTTEQHIMVGTDCSGADGCHDVHNQNPNSTGRFLRSEIVRTNNSYCETCHDETPFAGADHLGVHNTANSHYSDGETFICEGCHTIHGAVVQTTNPPGLTKPILLSDNSNGEFFDDFCITCHNGIAPAEAVAGTGGVTTDDPFDYTETKNDGTQSKHPTNTTSGPHPISGCDECHVPMCRQETEAHLFDLRADNTNSVYCLSCHTTPGAPLLTGNSHFSQDVPEDPTMNQGLTPALPWANELDEDGNAGPDWIAATVNMITCETCHSVHRRGYSGSEAGHLLRYPDDDANSLCQTCHSSY